VDWIRLAQDRVQWRVRFLYNAERVHLAVRSYNIIGRYRNSGMAVLLGNVRFLPDPSQFICHPSTRRQIVHRRRDGIYLTSCDTISSSTTMRKCTGIGSTFTSLAKGSQLSTKRRVFPSGDYTLNIKPAVTVSVSQQQ
jgi:hypothetical protein